MRLLMVSDYFHPYLLGGGERRMCELARKYPGKCIAFVDNKIVAVEESRLEAYKRAKKVHPKKEVSIVYVPKREETVTFL